MDHISSFCISSSFDVSDATLSWFSCSCCWHLSAGAHFYLFTLVIPQDSIVSLCFSPIPTTLFGRKYGYLGCSYHYNAIPSGLMMPTILSWLVPFPPLCINYFSQPSFQILYFIPSSSFSIDMYPFHRESVKNTLYCHSSAADRAQTTIPSFPLYVLLLLGSYLSLLQNLSTLLT